jgi:hypothetical protein
VGGGSLAAGAHPSPSLRWISANALEALGALLLLVAGFAVMALSRDWLLDKSRYLLAGEIASWPLAAFDAFVPSPAEIAATPAVAADAPPSQGTAMETELPSSPPPAVVTRAVAEPGADIPEPAAVLTTGVDLPLRASAVPTTTVPSADATPADEPAVTLSAVPKGLAPVRIRIPAIGVDRRIIELPRVLNPRTDTWTRDVDLLFRPGRKDLVGHWGGSALAGEPGNMILVGHNYGYGYNGVFLRLGRLRAGDKVTVVDEAGGQHVYRVKRVERVPWRKKDPAELLRHTNLLAVGGPERLTLVTCGGSVVAPFPERIYVVAEPVR